MKNTDIKSLFGPIAKTFQRYNLTIFIVVLVSGLAVSVLMLNNTLQQASNPGNYTPATDSTTFDQATIDRITQLHTSSEPSPELQLPEGRINPFSE